MKAFTNPLLLLVCILLLAFAYVSAAEGQQTVAVVNTWVLTLCLLGVIINGTLGVARALTGRPSLESLGWAVGFLIFGSVVWTLVSSEGMESVSSQERALLEQQVEAWQAGRQDPWHVDANGDCIVTLAAGLGKMDVLHAVVQGEGRADVLAQAVHCAAERNREQVLQLLIPAKVSADARLEDGSTPLHAAAIHRAHRAAACLLERGANVNAAMEDGSTPLHHAVLADDAGMVRLLLQHGADPARLNADGRDAASYARTEAVSEALEAAPPAP